ncbi:MAG: hypothetical protein GQ559_05945, partial [Desulfobulbaceae bacterium]|nr:hypothetical protein [Desulfobulbaceae bacterium]
MKIHTIVFFLTVFLMAAEVPAQEEASAGPDLSSIEVLDLQTAQEIALIANPTMEAAVARIEQARARVRQAVAAWWPSFDLTGTVSRNRASDTIYQQTQALANLYGQSFDRTSDDSTAGLQASWVLFDGFFRSFKQEEAEFGEKSTGQARQDGRRLLVASVAEAFFNAQLSQTKVDIAQADEAFYLRQLEDAQNRYDVGAGPWGDVLNIKVQLNSARTSLMLNRREFEAAGYGLAALLGVPDAAFPGHLRLASMDKDFAVSSKEENAEALIEEALSLRPDVRQLELQ